eukprot:gene739-20865_t
MLECHASERGEQPPPAAAAAAPALGADAAHHFT